MTYTFISTKFSLLSDALLPPLQCYDTLLSNTIVTYSTVRRERRLGRAATWPHVPIVTWRIVPVHLFTSQFCCGWWTRRLYDCSV